MSLSITRKVQPLASLHPYETLWRIKILLTDKGTMRTYSNARGEGCVFNVEFTDDDGTQMKATMFNEAAKKLYNVFEIGKVYYISKGTIKVANKQFRTVDNDLEMILNQNSQVEEAVNESMLKPEKTFNFVPIDQLGLHVNQNNLVDVIGVVQHVSPTISIRRKITQQIIPKRDIRVVYETKKSVVICLWNEHATSVGQELLEMADKSPIVTMKSLKVGEFKGVSLSTLSNSYIQINPDIPDCLRLKSWFASEGKEVALPSTELCFTPPMNSRSRSMYLDRVTLHYVTSNPSLGEDKSVYFSTRASMTFINPDHTMSYRSCNTCNKKVTESTGKGYWCARCQKNEESFTLRYILSAKFSDATGEAWFSIFDEQAQILLGCSADELAKMKAQEEGTNFLSQLKKAKWVSFLFRVSVARTEYNNVKRQKINVVDIRPIDFAAESSFLLNEIAAMKA